jgi:hypothetical protein
MADEFKRTPADPVDEQVQRLARGLRDDGVAPPRDLWGEVDAAITAAEQHQLRPGARRQWPRLFASAAAVAVLVVAGWWGVQQPTLEPTLEPASNTPAQWTAARTEESGLDMINQALNELNMALAADPDNRSLANLSLMLHQSRGRMMRQNTELRLHGV